MREITPPQEPQEPYKMTVGLGCAVERRNVPWPFDPLATMPRRQTWRNRRRIAARYVLANKRVFIVHGAAFVCWFALALLLIEVL